jgi:predicted O-linked N-acetylglucosamine transferase (SPINDLY family)
MATEISPPSDAHNAPDLLKQAVALHQSGLLQPASQLYEKILKGQPDHALANHNRGMLDVQRQQPELGLPYFVAAINADPAQAQYWLSYIDALIKADHRDEAGDVLAMAKQNGLEGEEVDLLQSRLDEHASATAEPAPAQSEMEAVAELFNKGHLQQASDQARAMTARYPRHGFGWKVLGLVLRAKGQLDAALNAMQQAVKLSSTDAETQCNLGLVLHELQHLEDAEEAYRRAIQLNPNHIEAWCNLGTLLHDQNRWQEAEDCHRHALQLNPNRAEAHYNLGNTLHAIGHIAEAIASYRKADRSRPGWVQAKCNLGAALLKSGKANEAEAALREALAVEPDHAEALNNLGNTLKEQNRLHEAEACYRHALTQKPKLAALHNNMGSLLQDMGRLAEAAASYREALRLKPDYHTARSNLLFMLNYDPSVDTQSAFAEAKLYGRHVAAAATSPFSDWNCDSSGQCLRIGLVSGDLRNHPVGYFLEGILGHLRNAQLQIHVYPTDSWVDELTLRIRSCCAVWKPLYGLDDQAAAGLIRSDGIHVLIDLSGHSRYNRLPVFAWKPAPVQVSWLGYFATTGVQEIDYLIADPVTLTKAQEKNFTEKIVRLPETRLCFTRPQHEAGISRLPALENDYITFGCFNNLAKMNDEVVSLWSEILRMVPKSRLFLKAKQLGDKSEHLQTVARFASCGIPHERLMLEGVASRDKYLAAYRRVDISLDPFPYPGGTTTAESLWMGVPVLTLAGESFLARQGAGLLENSGLPQWVAQSRQEYVELAIKHASDLQHLAALRQGLRQQVEKSPVMDTPRFARQLTAALREISGGCR